VTMIEKKTIVDQIEISRSGHIHIRFGLLLIEDGVELDCKWHRTVIEPGSDIDAQIAAVNSHLQIMGKATIDDSTQISRLKSVAALFHTSDVVAEHKARIAEQVAKDS
jgi:hypothetical protein